MLLKKKSHFFWVSRREKILLCRTVQLTEFLKFIDLTTPNRPAESAGAVEYTDCIFAEGLDHPPMSVLAMILNNLMVRFQSCWCLGEYRLPFLLPSLPGSFWFGVVAPEIILSMGEIELFDI